MKQNKTKLKYVASTAQLWCVRHHTNSKAEENW